MSCEKFCENQINCNYCLKLINFRLYPVSRRSGHDCRELEILSKEGEKNEVVGELQVKCFIIAKLRFPLRLSYVISCQYSSV